ncbi:MORC family CW-type zinc finger protein 3-like [Trichomycterus rosablanca]|uniref:MORC family CW-type zinc finger protein 3-like n=1 Tax=Trichomycterus rosablanca TaxID=2290929 RepID=UPI002F35D776
MAVQTERGIPVSAVSPRYLHTNSTSHTWPFSAIAELIDNAYDPDVKAKQFWIDKTVVKGQDCLTFMDNGAGMDYDKMHKMLSFGFSDKQTINGHIPVGLYGNGFKSGSMRLGKDAIVFSKKADVMGVGLLSQTYLEKIGAENVIVPVVTLKHNEQTISAVPEHEASLQDILTYSVFNTREELLSELDAIKGPCGTNSTGTRIIIWNLRKTASGKLEFDFKQDRYDIWIPVDVNENTNVSVPESEYSLRAYSSILYLKPRMQINIRGQKVKTQLISKSLAHSIKDTYKPQFLDKGIPIIFGYNTKSKDHYGLMIYHKNRLIKAYERVACQRKANSTGVGVIGVIECNYLSPTHNKQKFDNTDEYRKTIQTVSIKLEDYWKEIRHRLQKKRNCNTPIEDTQKRPDQNWVQCDECLKWRKLPDGIDNELLPVKWFCRMNPDPQFRSCTVEEEPEDSDDEEPRYQKTFRQHERNQKLQAEMNRQQVEDQKIAALTKQNAALRRQIQLGSPSSPASPIQATPNLSLNSSPCRGSGSKTSDDFPVISHVISLSTPARIKRTLDLSSENGEIKRARVKNGFDVNTPNSPSAFSNSSYSCSSPNLIIPDSSGDKTAVKDVDDDIVIVESCSTPRPKLTQPSFDITKVKLEHKESEDKQKIHTDQTDHVAMEDNKTTATTSLSVSTGHVCISTQTNQDNSVKKEVDKTDSMQDRNREEENQLEMDYRQEQQSTAHELGPIEEEPMELNENAIKLDQKSNSAEFPDRISPNISAKPLLDVKPEANLENMALNVVDAQQQQDNLMELLEAAAQERDESRAEQHRLILQVEELQSQLLELKQNIVKKEQNHQSTQTSPEMTQDYKVQYLEAKENIKKLQLELEELKTKGLDRENKSKESKAEALAEVDDDVACQIDLLLRELDERNKKQEELMKKVESLEDEKRNLLTCCESLQKDFKEAASAGSSNPGSGRDLQQDEMQKQAASERQQGDNNTQTCMLKLRKLRQRVARLLVTFVPALDLQQVNYDCDVIDEIVSQVIDEISPSEAAST